jgi:hypothetical protein
MTNGRSRIPKVMLSLPSIVKLYTDSLTEEETTEQICGHFVVSSFACAFRSPAPHHRG